jgi:DNA polymerase (family 10)
LVSDDELYKIKGIGKGIAEKIRELISTGNLKYYNALRAEIPPGLLDMIKIPGFGPKKAKTVWQELGLTTLGELEYACREHHLVDLPGFGEKTQQAILKGIEFIKRGAGRFHLNEAYEAAHALIDELEKLPQVLCVKIAGSLRRYKETIGDIDILVSTKKPRPIIERFTALPQIESVSAKGDTKASIVLSSGINVDLRAVDERQFPFAFQYFTGSKEHNVALRSRAKKLGYKLNEYGLFKGKSEKFTPCRAENEVYSKLELSSIAPELRENAGELEAAEGKLLPDLVKQGDLRGTFHCHTIYSDGRSRLDDYVKAGESHGWEYIGIADHSKSAAYANGLSEERILNQHREIDKINARTKGFKILKGIEVDILPSGELDYSNKILSKFDFVIASVHSRFNMSKRDMTNRIIRAMKNPCVNMLGHPTGRLLLAREGYAVDIHSIIRAAARHNVIIEINCHPFRLDLDWRYCKVTKEAGVLLSINPDAHDVEGLEDVHYGIGIARKGWLSPENVLNTFPLKEVLSKLKNSGSN